MATGGLDVHCARSACHGVILACCPHRHKSSSVYTSGASDTIPAGQPKITPRNRRNFGLKVTVHRDGKRPPLVAQWGGISLARDTTPRPLNDNPPTHLEQPPVRAGATAPGRRLRTVRVHRAGRGAPCSCPQRPQPQGAEPPTRMGHADGRTPPQDPCRLPRLPPGRPCRTSHTAPTMSTGEPDATETGHVRFGGGSSEKDQVTWHLVGGLPYVTYGSTRAGG